VPGYRFDPGPSEECAMPPSRKPWWLIVGVLLCLYAVYRWIAG
jgi:hypothetical protein